MNCEIGSGLRVGALPPAIIRGWWLSSLLSIGIPERLRILKTFG